MKVLWAQHNYPIFIRLRHNYPFIYLNILIISNLQYVYNFCYTKHSNADMLIKHSINFRIYDLVWFHLNFFNKIFENAFLEIFLLNIKYHELHLNILTNYHQFGSTFFLPKNASIFSFIIHICIFNYKFPCTSIFHKFHSVGWFQFLSVFVPCHLLNIHYRRWEKKMGALLLLRISVLHSIQFK